MAAAGRKAGFFRCILFLCCLSKVGGQAFFTKRECLEMHSNWSLRNQNLHTIKSNNHKNNLQQYHNLISKIDGIIRHQKCLLAAELIKLIRNIITYINKMY